MNYLKKLEKEAEQNFLHYDGFNDYVYEDAFDEDYDDEFDDFDDEYDDEYGGATGKLPNSERTVLINVENTNAVVTPVIILGAYRTLSLPGFGIPAGVNVTVEGSASYGQFLQEIAAAPMLITGMKVDVSNSSQLNQALLFRRLESTGRIETDPLYPSRYKSAKNFNANLIEIDEISFPLDGKLEIATNVLASSSFSLILNVTTKADPGRIVAGKSIIKRRRKRKR